MVAYVGDVEPVELLTVEEHAAISAAGRLYGVITRICGAGRTRDNDLSEAAMHVHALQQMVMSQAAARAFPAEYRLLGETILKTQRDDGGTVDADGRIVQPDADPPDIRLCHREHMVEIKVEDAPTALLSVRCQRHEGHPDLHSGLPVGWTFTWVPA